MKKWISYGAVAVTAAFLFSIRPVSAADISRYGASVTATQEQSPWQIRVRALGVMPRDDGKIYGIADSGLEFSKTMVPEVDITYYITDNLAAELILATSYSYINGAGSLDSFGNIGRAWFLPPTLTLQYHFTDYGRFKPYIGAGVNYTIFYNERGNRRPMETGRIHGLNIGNTWGGAVQVGFDYMLDRHLGLNFDIKKLYLRPDFDAMLDGKLISGKAKLDPWLIGAGITYRF